MENHFLRLQSILMQNFSVFENNVAHFIWNNQNILDYYVKSARSEEERFAFQCYSNHINRIFRTLITTSNFVKNMVILKSPIALTSASHTTVISTHNGFSHVTHRPLAPVDTSKYQKGFVIEKAIVTSVSSDKLFFHISALAPNDSNVLEKLFYAKDRKTYEYPPVPGTIFGLKMEGGIMRATHCLPISSGKVFLLDFGDVVQIDTDLNIFCLTKEEQSIPAGAIFCKLHCPNEEDECEKAAKRICLKKLLYRSAKFLVIENKNDVLQLKVLEHSNFIEEDSSNKLTREELEMLYEEPPCTSNALMAVMGYVPKDDQLICRFYDQKIDGCFKGKNCHHLHIPLREDYISKDIVLSNAFAEPRVVGVPVQYQNSEILKTVITHVLNFEYFYGIILENSGNLEQLVFTDRDITESDYLKKLPLEYDIVLAKSNYYGRWYRAQVLEVDEFKKTIKVFFIDYGNSETVPLKNLAKCVELFSKIPPQATQFRLADVFKNLADEDQEVKGLELLNAMILNKEVYLEVVSHYENLVVRFVDQPYSKIPQLLANKKLVRLIKMLEI